MKSFAIALIAGVAAAGAPAAKAKAKVAIAAPAYGYGLGYGHVGYAKVDYVPHTHQVQPAKKANAASKDYGMDYQKSTYSDWDAWGRDQDLAIDESYGKTNAKSYRAESYDEWDNEDADQWGGQGWGRDYDQYGRSSHEYDASKGVAAAGKAYKASWQGDAQASGYDNDAWAKQAYGQDYDSRWGKSYDSVEARNYANEHYAREVRADDDQWAEDRDQWAKGDYDAYGMAASADQATNGSADFKKASYGRGAEYWGGDQSDWDAWGRDQDFHEKVSYDDTWAKSYAAESYDEWDNRDADKWGGQAWGRDRDIYGASSYGGKASLDKYDGYAKGGKGGYLGGQYAKGGQLWTGASTHGAAAQAGYDNDTWAKQAYGQDQDARWGKSYDSVSARSYDNKKYARWLQADDDQWAEDYDRFDDADAGAYGKAASIWAKGQPAGKMGWAKGGEHDAASRAGHVGNYGKSGSDWDAWGRDQDLEVDESYEQTWAKSYDAESYDEWDNLDRDKWGAQAWGKDRDLYGASSYNGAASGADHTHKAYGGVAGYGGWGKGGAVAYGGKASAHDVQASAGQQASAGAYDADAWAKQAYGSDYDSRWGKSYDFVNANEYDDEQYARKVRADDDQWAEDWDVWSKKDADAYGKAASAHRSQPKITKTTYTPHVSYGGYGYGGYGW